MTKENSLDVNKKLSKEQLHYFYASRPARPPMWYKIRLKVLERDNHVCKNCYKEGNDVHHIIPRIEGGTATLDNLITLCHVCHMRIEPHVTYRQRLWTARMEDGNVKDN